MDDATAGLTATLAPAAQRARRASGLDIAFIGTTEPGSPGRRLVISSLSGARSTALRGLRVPSGIGLGGRVLAVAHPVVVSDYAAAADITHDYDAIVVGHEGITSVAAVPITRNGRVHAVIYGGTRQGLMVGDRAVRALEVAARQIAAATPQPELPAQPDNRAALDELDRALALASGEMRTRLERVRALLEARPPASPSAPALTARERDVLRHVADGATNLEIAVAEGLRPETVKAYLRSAMHKLGAHTRAAACLHADRLGLLGPAPAHE
ncbi:LuxR C-terminal-related transcriptional regulator [Microbacterium sp. SORGH_AS_0888]|uniref:helix-turn-helix transcriptional regulator n=1 Tax=Microbacterium sp. SORGH_AS_0888 TaxID=3041791 RepID=UPI002782E623|nr:LuxR C-terminal-related transcriptional regulator [Microbacterium sp. SORGH_AS_0888]MDQ1128097.1 DNA-binding CsgD family transcriptional regulator/HAMP domain-containing protein [Microbacterium sp. SORGH_AS_0888]